MVGRCLVLAVMAGDSPSGGYAVREGLRQRVRTFALADDGRATVGAEMCSTADIDRHFDFASMGPRPPSCAPRQDQVRVRPGTRQALPRYGDTPGPAIALPEPS